MTRNKEVNAKQVWNDEKIQSLTEFVLIHSKKQSNARKLKNELLAIQYQLEDYIENENPEKRMRIIDFIEMYLKIFQTTKKNLAFLFEMQDSNLHKYLTGERRLNRDMLLKLSSFTNTKPEYWLKLEMRNDLHDLANEKRVIHEYKKYSYRNLSATVRL